MLIKKEVDYQLIKNVNKWSIMMEFFTAKTVGLQSEHHSKKTGFKLEMIRIQRLMLEILTMRYLKHILAGLMRTERWDIRIESLFIIHRIIILKKSLE